MLIYSSNINSSEQAWEKLAERVKTQALNLAEEWGPSVHCRIATEVAV